MADSIQIKSIGLEHIRLLQQFVDELGDAKMHFRYFSSRLLSVISNHIITLLALDSQDVPLAYGHLDVENKVVWLGVCVLPLYWGKA